jgi:outer membrane protein OmpA-like peptidoglycan-associated protein
MTPYKTIISATMLIATLAGCAKSYSNKELRDIFSERGLETGERNEGVVIFLPGVFFEVDKADLTQPAQLKVGEIATVINDPRVAERKLLLEGHTDSTGTEEYNMELSLQRAETVRQGLIAGKVSTERMSTRGFGEQYPIAENTNPDGSPNPEGQAKNRRVEIVVKNTDTKVQ